MNKLEAKLYKFLLWGVIINLVIKSFWIRSINTRLTKLEPKPPTEITNFYANIEYLTPTGTYELHNIMIYPKYSHYEHH